MKARGKCISDLRTSWLPALALVVMLYLMYSPVFLTDYLMQDEWNVIGSRDSLTSSARNAFFRYGRGLHGIYEPLVYQFVNYDPLRVQFIRFINLSSLATIAFILFLFLSKRSKSPFLAFLVILFLFSQRSFQSAVAYSLQLISNTQPAMWLSLVAFYTHFNCDGRFLKRLRPIVVFLILMLAMQSTQTFAFFSMIPLAYLTLTDWGNQKRKVVEFLLLAAFAFLVSSVVYKVGLGYWQDVGGQGYGLGEQGLEAVAERPIKVFSQAVHPASYWGAFEIWSYPFPFHSMLPLKGMKREIAGCFMIFWGILVSWAAIAEFRKSSAQEKRQVVFKWLAVLLCLGFGAVFLVADAPLRVTEHRPHLTITFVGVAVFCGAYSLEVLASKYPLLNGAVVKCLGVILVLASAFGAQAGVLRGFVDNRAAQLDFMRTELTAGCPSGCRNIIVVLPNWHGCLTEPCGPWVGHVTEGEGHMRQEGAYRYALATSSISPESVKFTFVDERPSEVPKDSIIFDWNRYVAGKKAHRRFLRHRTPL